MVRAAVAVLLVGCGSVDSASPDAPPLDALVQTDATPGDASDGLVAWYPMDTLEVPIMDASGHQHNGVCGNNSDAVCPMAERMGRIDGAYSFSNNQFFRVLSTADLKTTNGFTVAVWVTRQSDAAGACVVNKGFGSEGNNSWQACLDRSGAMAFYAAGPDGADTPLYGTTNVPLNEWHHIALTWNRSVKSIYLDGMLDVAAANTVAIGFDNDDITIGSDIDSGAIESPLTGLLDDVRIYDHALSGDQIHALATP